jgi:hypothetical protein
LRHDLLRLFAKASSRQPRVVALPRLQLGSLRPLDLWRPFRAPPAATRGLSVYSQLFQACGLLVAADITHGRSRFPPARGCPVRLPLDRLASKVDPPIRWVNERPSAQKSSSQGYVASVGELLCRIVSLRG